MTNAATIWDSIKGKAHLYKTAKIAGTEYELVAILGNDGRGNFTVRRINGWIETYNCRELDHFVL